MRLKPAAASAPSDSAAIEKPWTGDLDGMIKRRLIRVLVPYSKGTFALNAFQRQLGARTFFALRWKVSF